MRSSIASSARMLDQPLDFDRLRPERRPGVLQVAREFLEETGLGMRCVVESGRQRRRSLAVPKEDSKSRCISGKDPNA